jgi:hypothetical protein
MAAIVLGSDAIDRASTSPSGFTFIYLANPATVDGWITSFLVYVATTVSVIKIGLFYSIGGGSYKCRSSITTGNLAPGLHTITGFYMPVVAGDYVGWWLDAGAIDRADSGGAGVQYVSGEYADPGDETGSTTNSAGRLISVQATGATDVTPPAVLDSLTENLLADLAPAFAGYPQPVFDYTLGANDTESEVTFVATLSGATIKYSYGSTVDKEVPSGVGETIPLATGDNAVTIKVQKAGYVDSQYNITVTRVDPTYHWEYIKPSSDDVTGWPTINPAYPLTHYDKVSDLDPTGSYIGSSASSWVYDRYVHGNPVYRGTTIKKIRLFALLRGANASSSYRWSLDTNSSVYNTVGSTAPGVVQKWQAETFKLNPVTTNPWTLGEIDALKAGVGAYDTGVPAGVYCWEFLISVIWTDAAIRTDAATGYTGTQATLNGTILNNEGNFISYLGYSRVNSQIQVRFNWGETVAYGTNTAWQEVASGSFSQLISGLDPSKTYHFRTEIQVRDNDQNWESFYGEDQTIPGGAGGSRLRGRIGRRLLMG